MVSTHQQYLCPDFLNPLPSTSASSDTADSSKSPLALLAQTCNSIGLPDLPTAKSRGGGGVECQEDQRKSTRCDGGKNGSCSDAKQHRYAESTAAANGTFSSSLTSGTPMSKCAKSAPDDDPQTQLSNGHTKVNNSSDGENRSPLRKDRVTAQALPPSISAYGSTTTSSSCPAAVPPPPPPPPLVSNSPYAALFTHLSPSSLCSGAAAVAAAAAAGGAGHPFAAAFSPALLAGALSYPCFGGLSNALNRYPRPCTDPFCKTCPTAAAAAAAAAINRSSSSCPFGCTQCAAGGHSDLPSSLWLNPYAAPLLAANIHAAALPTPMTALSNPTMSSLIAAQTMSLAAAAAAATTTSGQQQPYVCNWMTVDQYCGKRFASGDELLQHLRSHATHDALKSAAAATTSTTVPPGRLCQRPSTSNNSTAATYSRFHPYAKMLATSTSAMPIAALNSAYSTLATSLRPAAAGQRLHPQP